MRSLKYVPGCGAAPVSFDGESGVWAGPAADIRGHEWSYTLGAAALTGRTLKAREASLTVLVLDNPSELDRMRAAFDADMAAGTPGQLVADEWSASCYITKSDVSSVTPRVIEAKLTVALLTQWRRTVSHDFYPLGNEMQLDLPTDLPADAGGSFAYSTLSVDGLVPVECALRVYGPAANPSVRIGNNTYSAAVSVPAGSQLLLDGIGADKKAWLIDEYGNRTNVTDRAERGTGQGCGSYCFQPVPPGVSQVGWTGGFSFTLDLAYERSEPAWSD